MMTILRRHALLILAATALACSATAPAADETAQDGPPACLHCGATCGLRPICVCKPGTTTVSEPEFSVTCGRICVPGCGSKPWPWCRRDRASGCTSCTDCGDRPCGCPGRVRQRKVLARKTVDTEQAVVTRSVGYVCCRCEAADPSRGHGCRPPRWETWRGCFDWIASLWRH